MRLETITLEDLKATIDSLIEIHGPNKEVTDFNITIANSNTVDYDMLNHIVKAI